MISLILFRWFHFDAFHFFSMSLFWCWQLHLHDFILMLSMISYASIQTPAAEVASHRLHDDVKVVLCAIDPYFNTTKIFKVASFLRQYHEEVIFPMVSWTPQIDQWKLPRLLSLCSCSKNMMWNVMTIWQLRKHSCQRGSLKSGLTFMKKAARRERRCVSCQVVSCFFYKWAENWQQNCFEIRNWDMVEG